MTRLHCHHRPSVQRCRADHAGRRFYLPGWFALCRNCGKSWPGDDWHAAYTFARDHAESSLT